ncbi:hypothetical protein [Ectopseudomonas toyotomiensis]|uniref:Uncharacterized protein n=1 Tax=Ectopseudomonas toyotomiensis TaxID=554344 RepID=A0AA42IMR0_9GAMM|nr:hypothetical protein [Pseudomonas toyotomiensis]MBG0839019.1 hypothetical protein [Pseudomonas toyotomiensis]MDH0699906.1 hypothetical protein [Pseudomonas toyotomiensis]
MAIPYITCLFPPDMASSEKIYVVEFGIDGGLLREGWIARLASWGYPTLRDSDGLYYFTETAGTDGDGLKMYSAALVGDDDEPALQLVREMDLDLPSHLPQFTSRVGIPEAVLHQGGAAMVGCAGYLYSSPGGWVSVGVAFADSAAGTLVNGTNTTDPIEALTRWNGAVELSDGSFAAYDWGLPE